MRSKSIRGYSMTLAVLLCLTLLGQTAFAGPPLLCHPFQIGGARSLPWSGSAWRDVTADYPISRLVDDTLSLLTPQAPILVRMETLRRATVYSAWSLVDKKTGYAARDQRVALELLGRLQQRAAEAKGKGASEALALFDLGYLVESYKQAGVNVGQIDGVDLVTKAIRIGGSDPVMEFAAAIMTIERKDSTQKDHLQKAVAGARDGSLLAQNLAIHFPEMGRSLRK